MIKQCCGKPIDLELELLEMGIEATESFMKELFLVDIAKALDPMDDGDFVKISMKLAEALVKATAQDEALVVTQAIQRLDVDWPNLNAAQRERIIVAATSVLDQLPTPRMVNGVRNVFDDEAEGLVEGTKRSVNKKYGFRLTTDITRQNLDIVRFVEETPHLFVTDEYGRRQDLFSRTARRVVSQGIEQGLGRTDIAEDLEKWLGPAKALNKSKNYYQLLASTYVQNARQWTQLQTFQEAGVSQYRFVAVVDEATTLVCKMLNGKVFTVDSGISTMNEIFNSDPEDIKTLSPWVQEANDSNGNRVLYTKTPSGGKNVLATVSRGADGRPSSGSINQKVSDDALAASGVPVPPLHGFCRSTLVAEV